MEEFRSSPRFLLGRAYEQLMAVWLRRRDWYVNITADYSGALDDHAPAAQGARDRILLPDLDIARKGIRLWAEVKAKAHADYTIKTGTYDHGIGFYKWVQYCRIQHETGCRVYLFIIEVEADLVLADSLDHLGAGRLYEGDKMDYGGMVFWDREQFRHRAVLHELPGLFDGAPFPFEKP